MSPKPQQHSGAKQPVVSVLPQRTRVVVVDDSPEFLEVICGLLRLEDSLEVAGTANDGTGAIQLASELQPEIMLMDVNMPFMNGLKAALVLSQHFPQIKVILMSSDDSLATRIACKSSGAHALVYKPAFRAQFFHALEKVSLMADSQLLAQACP
jgi:DNA-binding NarL/FixJ family response regulator